MNMNKMGHFEKINTTFYVSSSSHDIPKEHMNAIKSLSKFETITNIRKVEDSNFGSTYFINGKYIDGYEGIETLSLDSVMEEIKRIRDEKITNILSK